MQHKLKARLSFFTFLQYFVWGSWYVSLGTYLSHTLHFAGGQIGMAYGTFAIGAMVSPFFIGVIADRYFASERILGVLGIVGGLLMFVLANTVSFASFYTILILYCITYLPTLALGTSLALHHLINADHDLPQIKAFSAVGFIVASVVLSILFKAEQSATQFYIAGTASLFFGLYSFTLPHTPPLNTQKNIKIGEILGLDALSLFKNRSFSVFMICLFLICIPIYFYFVSMAIYVTELDWDFVVAKLSLAQLAEFFSLLLLPLVIKYLGYKRTIMIGMATWAVRYFLLAGSVDAVSTGILFIYLAILVHGVCYDYLFITGQLYVDQVASKKIRGAAQGLVAFMLWGLGAFVGTYVAGFLLDVHTLENSAGGLVHDWKAIWTYPAWASIIVAFLFIVFFKDPANRKNKVNQEG